MCHMFYRAICSIEIPGAPTGWRAPQFSLGRLWSPHGENKFYIQHRVREIAQQAGIEIPVEGPISLSFTFRFKRVKKKEKFHIKRPDLTNLVKLAEDCLSGIVFHDDRQVVESKARKELGEPGTLIEVFSVLESES